MLSGDLRAERVWVELLNGVYGQAGGRLLQSAAFGEDCRQADPVRMTGFGGLRCCQDVLEQGKCGPGWSECSIARLVVLRGFLPAVLGGGREGVAAGLTRWEGEAG